jgi:hypothetical protein
MVREDCDEFQERTWGRPGGARLFDTSGSNYHAGAVYSPK